MVAVVRMRVRMSGYGEDEGEDEVMLMVRARASVAHLAIGKQALCEPFETSAQRRVLYVACADSGER